MDPNDPVVVRLLEPGAAQDGELVDRLTRLVNDVYATAERGLWRDEFTRTTAPELAELIAARQIAVATRHGRGTGERARHASFVAA